MKVWRLPAGGVDQQGRRRPNQLEYQSLIPCKTYSLGNHTRARLSTTHCSHYNSGIIPFVQPILVHELQFLLYHSLRLAQRMRTYKHRLPIDRPPTERSSVVS